MTTITAHAGLLIDPGTAMVWLMMHQRPVPTSPPSELRAVVVPVRDHHDQLIDWRFRPPADGSHPDLGDIFERVHAWREEWLVERAVGDAATLRTVLGWGDRKVGVSALHVLGVPDAKLEPEAVPVAGLQARKLRTAMDGESGPALIDTDSRRIVRAFAPVEGRTVLLTAGTTGLVLAGESVELTSGESVSGWAGADLQTASGPRATTTAEAALLSRVAPGHDRITVSRVELTRLFAPLLASLVDLTELASGGHQALYVRRGLS